MNATRKTMSRMFPDERLLTAFPWALWAVGWLAILKGVLWLATDPTLPVPLLKVVGIQHLLLLFPFVVGGIGLWNKKKWALWVTVVAALIDLAGYFVYPEALAAFKLVETSILAALLGGALVVANGPLGDVLILIATPLMLKQLGAAANGKKIAKTT